ncbi:hypothetical protein SK128_006298, partial [Halocaridina rubra]
ALAGVSKLRPRDKTPEKLELLFTLTQAVMVTKYAQVMTLEEELGKLAESAGKRDAQREEELEAEVSRLRKIVAHGQAEGFVEDENVAYVRLYQSIDFSICSTYGHHLFADARPTMSWRVIKTTFPSLSPPNKNTPAGLSHTYTSYKIANREYSLMELNNVFKLNSALFTNVNEAVRS